LRQDGAAESTSQSGVRPHLVVRHRRMSGSARLDLPQLRLFESREPTVDRTFASARRTALDAHSWVEHIPEWLCRHDVLFESLAGVGGWEQRRRWMYERMLDEPRLTAEYPILADAPVPLLRTIGAVLSEHYSVLYDNAWLNLYRDHNDSTSWHADRPASVREESVVPVLSLGDTRRFLVRRREGGPSRVFVAVGGDLIVMGGRCQRDWVHSVPKETRSAGARISVNFGSREQATRIVSRPPPR
jgi:alkylated DNA repair dioxygenase AlkB